MTTPMFAMAVLGVGIVILPGSMLWAQEGLGQETFAVVQVGDELHVVPSSEVPTLRQKVQEEFREALQQYRDAKKEAQKAGEKFTDPKPKVAAVKVLADSILTEEEANRVLEKHRERLKKAPGKGKGFVIVRIDGKYEVSAASAVVDLKEKIKADYKEARAEYALAKKEAKKNKEKFNRPAPKKASFKVMNGTFPTEEAAQEQLEKLKEKERKKKEKKDKAKKRDSKDDS